MRTIPSNFISVSTPSVVKHYFEHFGFHQVQGGQEIVGRLDRLAAREGVDNRIGINPLDRKEWHHLRKDIRQMGFQLPRQSGLLRHLDQWWDQLCGAVHVSTGILLDDTTSYRRELMEWKDVDALIKKVAKENYIWPIDMGVEFLLRRRNLFVGTNRDVDPALEECLMQLAREHPLRLHSELGIKYYLQLIEMSAERRQEQWIQKLLDQGNVRGGDARVIPIVMALAKKHPGMFTPKHMITLLEINERFPQVAGIWECFRNHPELLFAAIYDAHGDWGNVDICKDLVSGMCDIGGDRLKEWVETRILPRLLMKFQQEEKAELSDWKLYSTLAEILPHEVFDNHFEEYISIEDDQEYSFDLLNKFTTPVIFHQMLLLADRQDSRAEIFRNFLINRRARAFCSGQNILCSHDQQRASFLSDLWKIVNGIEHV